jgi:hypothetical protein
MRRVWLALVLVTTAPLVQAQDPLVAIDACLAQLDGLDVGYERIAARCPDLAPSLESSAWHAWLPRDWNRPHNQLSSSGLMELRTLLPREGARLPPGHEPRAAAVSGALATVRDADHPRSFWQRFKAWLHELFTPSPQPVPDSWLQRLLIRLHLPPTLTRWIGWIAFAIVAVIGIAIVVNELRLAGWFAARRRRGGLAPGAGRGTRMDITLEALERATAADQPRLLLELVAARLIEQARLPPARALTVRELSRAARLEAAADRSRLNELALICERVRFSDQEVAPAILARSLAQGRELLASLDAPLAQPRGA